MLFERLRSSRSLQGEGSRGGTSTGIAFKAKVHVEELPRESPPRRQMEVSRPDFTHKNRGFSITKQLEQEEAEMVLKKAFGGRIIKKEKEG